LDIFAVYVGVKGVEIRAGLLAFDQPLRIAMKSFRTLSAIPNGSVGGPTEGRARHSVRSKRI
jgi:hypothetical protein